MFTMGMYPRYVERQQWPIDARYDGYRRRDEREGFNAAAIPRGVRVRVGCCLCGCAVAPRKSGYFRAHSSSAAAIRVATQTVFPADEWTTRASHSVGERH